MLRYTFATEKDFAFRSGSFTICSVQIGVYAVFFLFLQLITGLTQIRHFFNPPDTPLPLIAAVVDLGVAAFVFLFGSVGVLSVNAKWIIGALFTAFLRLLGASLLSVFAFIYTTNFGFRPFTLLGVNYVTLVPIHVASMFVFFRFLRFAHAFSFAQEVDESQLVTAVKFFCFRQDSAKNK